MPIFSFMGIRTDHMSILLENGKKRLVLGDWRMDKKEVNAVIAVGYDKGIELLTFTKIK